MKKIVSLLLALVLCLSISAASFAYAAEASQEESPVPAAMTAEEPLRAEETQWVTRITEDGLIQARLWSITYGYWKTDWITIGHT